MGIKILYILAIIYTIISSLGFFHKALPSHFIYIFLLLISLYYLFYALRRKVNFSNTVLGGIFINLAVQLTGGLDSQLLLAYFLILALISYKENPTNYWIIASCLFGTEVLSAIMKHAILMLPIIFFAVVIMIIGIIAHKRAENELTLKRSLIKYESKDEFFRPANFKHHKIMTSVKEIDRHQGIERPLLYFVRFIHEIFEAQTTAIFACHNNKQLSLIQGFSHSELYYPDLVIDLESGIYRQVIDERKSILIREFTLNPESLGFYKGSSTISSVMIAPIILMDTVEGVFVIDRKTGQFNENDKKFFDEASYTLSHILAMVRSYEREQNDTKYLNAIQEVAKEVQKQLDLELILMDAIKAFKNSMKFDDISVAKIDEFNNCGVVIKSTYIKENTKFSLDDGLVGLIAKHKSNIIKDDLCEGKLVVLKKGEKIRNLSFVGIPIKQDDKLFGVIWFEDHRKERFNEDDVRNLNTLASQLSLAWQRAQLYYKVQERANLDGLTELYNHRHFQEILEQEISKAKELVLMMLDIDHFKQINDTYGHLAGDKVLKFLGKLISQSGIAARYGGEEFTIILPGCSLKKAAEIAVRLKDNLKKNEIKFNQIKIKITVSIGIAHYPRDAKSRIELIEKADQALYFAKNAGRDQIVIAQTMARKADQNSAVER